MTKDQILKKAIKKVKIWLGDKLISVSFDEEGISVDTTDKDDFLFSQRLEYSDKGYYALIFSHEFAKAFWGEDIVDAGDYEETTLYEWQYHLGKMVLEEEPLKYIKKFL